MSTLVPTFALGGIEIPQLAGLEMDQEYEDLEGAETIRMTNGSLKKITIWNGKIETKVTGFGRVPTGFTAAALDYTVPLTMKCMAPRPVKSASNVITVPAARRTDMAVQVIGIAFLDGYNMIGTNVSMASNVATLTTVSGAIGYMALYFPQISVYSSPPSERYDRIVSRWRWSLEAKEA